MEEMGGYSVARYLTVSSTFFVICLHFGRKNVPSSILSSIIDKVVSHRFLSAQREADTSRLCGSVVLCVFEALNPWEFLVLLLPS